MSLFPFLAYYSLAGAAIDMPVPRSVCWICPSDSESEPYRRILLKIVRAEMEGMQSGIAHEKLVARLEEMDGQFEKANIRRLAIEKMKADLDSLRKRERKLWEQQPGGITAPPPRLVKREKSAELPR